MAWLSRVNFISSDTLSFTDINNLGNDIRAWGGNVNGGGYTLSNVVLSASAGTMATVIGGTGTTSTLTLRSTSGVGTTGADIIFQAGNNGATETMRIQNGGNVGIGTSSPATESTNAKLAIVGSVSQSASTLATSNSNAGFTVRANAGTGYQLAIGSTSVDGSPYIQGVVYNGGAAASNLILQGYGGTVGIGTASPATESTNAKLAIVGALSQAASSLATANSAAGFTVRTNQSSGYQLAIGAVSVDGSPYLQGLVFNGGSSASNLILQGYGGNVGIGTTSPATSAKLEIGGTTGALLVPRLTTTERNALSAVNGMIIYNTTDNKMQGRINGAWTDM